MNTKDWDIEQMRKIWIEMGRALGMDIPQSGPDNLDDKKTALDRLRDRYRKGCDWSIVGTILFTLLFLFIPWINNNYRVSLTITYAIMMSANSYVLYWLWQGTGKINPLTMSITAVSSMAKYYKRCHLRYILIVLPIALLWVGYFAYVVSHSTFGSIGSIIIGFIIGGIFSLYGLWKDLKDYRNLTK